MATTAALSKQNASRRLPPGPKGLPLVGITAELVKDPLGFFYEAFQQYGDIVYFHVGNRQFYMLNHPDDVQHVLQGNHRNFHKASTYEKLRPLLGNGLVTSEGAYWLRQRRLIQPAFHRKHLTVFALVMTQAAGEMLDRWEASAQNGQPLDVASEFMHVTLEIVSRAMFSTDTAGFSDQIGQNLPIVLERTNERFWELLDLSRLPTARNRHYWKSLGEMDKVIYQIIEQRRRSSESFDDLLTMLLEAVDEETGERMTDQQLRDEVITIYLAGHETTANALSWAQTLIPIHPEVEGKLQNEVDSVLQGRIPTMEDIPNLTYTRMVIDEVLRVYPSVWSVARTPLTTEEIGGYSIGPGANISLTPYITHRHPAFWEHPEVFDPERFSSERSAGRHPYAYFPFGGGPRLCIGNNFALTEATLLLAMITQRYKLELVPEQVIEPQPVVTLRPRHGVRVYVRPR
jgi:cytochrome P450